MATTSILASVVLAAAVCATSASAAPVFQGKKKDPQVFALSDCSRLRTAYEQAQQNNDKARSPSDLSLAEMYAIQAANQCDGNYTYSGVTSYARAIQLLGRNPAY